MTEIDGELDSNWTCIPAELQRQSDFLQHPVFYRYHSETEMLRYLKHLENKDKHRNSKTLLLNWFIRQMVRFIVIVDRIDSTVVIIVVSPPPT